MERTLTDTVREDLFRRGRFQCGQRAKERRRTSKTSLLLLPEMKDMPAQREELGLEIVWDTVSVKNHASASGTKVASTNPLDLDGHQGGSKSDLEFLLVCTLHFPTLLSSFLPWFPPTVQVGKDQG